MFEALKDIVCFATTFVCFLCGTRIAWASGKKCQFNQKPEARFESLLRSIPSASIIYFFGFLIVFSYVFNGFMSKTVFSITSAFLLAITVVSMAMPELKRKPVIEVLIPTELVDGLACRMTKQELNTALADGLVVKFKRSDGWALVGKDPMREMKKKAVYTGVERRQFAWSV
jgi:hypothetical protein